MYVFALDHHTTDHPHKAIATLMAGPPWNTRSCDDLTQLGPPPSTPPKGGWQILNCCMASQNERQPNFSWGPYYLATTWNEFVLLIHVQSWLLALLVKLSPYILAQLPTCTFLDHWRILAMKWCRPCPSCMLVLYFWSHVATGNWWNIDHSSVVKSINIFGCDLQCFLQWCMCVNALLWFLSITSHFKQASDLVMCLHHSSSYMKTNTTYSTL